MSKGEHVVFMVRLKKGRSRYFFRGGLMPRRVVGKGDQDKNDIPPFELLHSAEKVPKPGVVGSYQDPVWLQAEGRLAI